MDFNHRPDPFHGLIFPALGLCVVRTQYDFFADVQTQRSLSNETLFSLDEMPAFLDQ